MQRFLIVFNSTVKFTLPSLAAEETSRRSEAPEIRMAVQALLGGFHGLLNRERPSLVLYEGSCRGLPESENYRSL